MALCILVLSLNRTTTKLTTTPIFVTPTVWSALNPAPDSLATFTGNASYSGFDKDGDGYFDYLKANVEVQTKKAGDFSFFADLMTVTGDMIGIGGGTTERRSDPAITVSLNKGIQYVSIYFDGNDIRYDNNDGPYQVIITMYAQDRIEFITAPINHRDFWYKDGARCDYAIQMFCRLLN